MRIGIGTSIVGGGFIGTSAPATEYLDQIEGAGTPTAAYSVDKVVSTYTDAVVRVRRASDNEEADVAFDNDTITLDSAVDNFSTGSLSATLGEFVAASGYTDVDSLGSPQDAFVATWYDQAGSNDATQIVGDYQPQIVSAGALVTENGKVALDFDGVDDYLEPTITGFQSISNLSTFSVITPAAAAAADTPTMTIWSFGQIGGSVDRTLNLTSVTGALSNEKIVIPFENGTARRLGSSTYSRSTNEQSLIDSFHLSTGTSLFSQGSEITLNLSAGMTTSTAAAPSNTGYTTDDKVQIGAAFVSGTGAVAFEQEKFQELIIYNTDKSALRTAIEGNINGRFNIYP